MDKVNLFHWIVPRIFLNFLLFCLGLQGVAILSILGLLTKFLKSQYPRNIPILISTYPQIPESPSSSTEETSEKHTAVKKNQVKTQTLKMYS